MDGGALNAGLPIPLVKHGIIAALDNAMGEFFVDAINNQGFSGGPVVRCEDPKSPTIIGVVSGYIWANEPVYKKNAKTDDLSVHVNTGLLRAFKIELAIAAIKKNPIGFAVQSAPSK